MDKIIGDISGIAMAIVGVAILYTLVNPKNKTAEVVQASAGGFGLALAAAMGGSGQVGGLSFGNR